MLSSPRWRHLVFVLPMYSTCDVIDHFNRNLPASVVSLKMTYLVDWRKERVFLFEYSQNGPENGSVLKPFVRNDSDIRNESNDCIRVSSAMRYCEDPMGL